MSKLLFKGAKCLLVSIIGIWGIASCQTTEELKKEQYFVEGFRLYQANCANCHQDDGAGMAKLYPSIAGSPLLGSDAVLACLIKNGSKGDGPLKRPMPANPKLTELELAEIITYMNMKWASDTIAYTPTEMVHEALKACNP